jgi:hypothetical protein
MGKILFLILIFVVRFSQAQEVDVERFWTSNTATIHSAVKLKSFYQIDSLYQDSTSNISITVAPDVLFAFQQDAFRVKTGINVVFQANWKSKMSFISNYRVGYSNQATTIYESVLQPKAFFANPLKKNQSIYHDIRGRFAYTPNKYLQFQTGIDHMFIGEGERSLFLGNQGVPNPFAQLKVKLWKFEYHFIQQFWREGIYKRYAPKGNTSHYLSFKANKKWSFGFFETVVYDMKDTLYNRGLELEYLNPVVFFRPQEYNLGSSDNVLLGLDFSYQVKKSMLYGQVIVDDFFLKEIRARNRWWANKFGVQLGFKTWIDKGENHFFVRSELNIVRPFTYSQVNRNAVYGNSGLTAAHPLGSNFVEFYQEVAFQRKDWKVQLWIQAYLKGLDSIKGAGASFGGDIYQSYNFRPEEYNFTIGRGITTHVVQIGTQVSKSILNQNLQLFVEPRIRIVNTEGTVQNKFYLTVGFQRKLGADRRNY